MGMKTDARRFERRIKKEAKKDWKKAYAELEKKYVWAEDELKDLKKDYGEVTSWLKKQVEKMK